MHFQMKNDGMFFSFFVEWPELLKVGENPQYSEYLVTL
jgi:hypothetical protein